MNIIITYTCKNIVIQKYNKIFKTAELQARSGKEQIENEG